MTRSFRVGLTADFRPDRGASVLDAALRACFDPTPDLAYAYFETHLPEVSPEQLRDLDVVISLLPRFTRESFRGVNRLVGIGRWGVGYDMIDVEACTEADVVLFITPQAVRRPMAEAILCLLLALSKDLVWKDRLVRDGRWTERVDRFGVCLPGRTIGTIGLGNIGRELLRLARPLGFGRLLAYEPYGAPVVAAELGAELVSLEALLAESDFVCINCPLTPETRHLIGEVQLHLMKRSAYLINTARGGIVDTTALVRALQEGVIRGAALDVFEDEPLPQDHSLCRLDNVILSPHAIVRTEEVIRDTGAEVCQGTLELYEGRFPLSVVNPDVLERPGFRRKLKRLRQERAAARTGG